MKIEVVLNWKHKILLSCVLVVLVGVMGYFIHNAVAEFGRGLIILPVEEAEVFFQ